MAGEIWAREMECSARGMRIGSMRKVRVLELGFPAPEKIGAPTGIVRIAWRDSHPSQELGATALRAFASVRFANSANPPDSHPGRCGCLQTYDGARRTWLYVIVALPPERFTKDSDKSGSKLALPPGFEPGFKP